MLHIDHQKVPAHVYNVFSDVDVIKSYCSLCTFKCILKIWCTKTTLSCVTTLLHPLLVSFKRFMNRSRNIHNRELLHFDINNMVLDFAPMFIS